MLNVEFGSGSKNNRKLTIARDFDSKSDRDEASKLITEYLNGQLKKIGRTEEIKSLSDVIVALVILAQRDQQQQAQPGQQPGQQKQQK